MRIGELATKAGVNIQTIRFYERRRLLPEPARTPSGYRSYRQTDLEKVQFIKWSQQLGFTLREVQQLLQLHSAVASLPSPHLNRNSEEVQDIIHMAEEKLSSIEEKLRLLKTMGEQLTTTIKKLQGQAGPVCPASKGPVGSYRH